MNRKTKLTIAIAAAVLGVLGVTAFHTQSVHAQNNAATNNAGQNNDKYSLISPSGIAFSDCRGY